MRAITSRNRGHKVQTVIDELVLYVRGWLNYYKLSSTYKEVLALAVWVRRRVRLYYWKPWNARPEGSMKRPGGRTLALPKEATSRARVAATCWHWERIPPRCTWRREAGKATLLR